MNEQIREILSRCQLESIDGPEYPRWTDLEKFAELIVRECAEICLEANDHKNILRHFGVEE